MEMFRYSFAVIPYVIVIPKDEAGLQCAIIAFILLIPSLFNINSEENFKLKSSVCSSKGNSFTKPVEHLLYLFSLWIPVTFPSGRT